MTRSTVSYYTVDSIKCQGSLHMLNNLLDRIFDPQGSVPNKFTIELGNRVREARKQLGISQRDLAKIVYRRQATISDIENGKSEPTASTLLYLSYALQKPIGYFIPFGIVELELNDLVPKEQELIFQVRRLMHETDDDEEIDKLIAQVGALADLAARQS